MSMTETPVTIDDFIRTKVREDIAAGQQRVQTRFPPEPNGYLHVGHAKAIIQDFDVAREFGGVCKLRFDDTNPETEKTEYIESIIDDIAWLGFVPDEVVYASDYFDKLYEWAQFLIKEGKAYVDEQTAEEISAQRGGFGKPGVHSRYRDRPATESLELFARMKAGEFPDGSKCLRAKIDMQHENVWLRDPVMYRIRHEEHPRTKDQWCIYPTYDWAHGQSDAIEGVTHSICTLEFDSHRPLYDWYLANLPLAEVTDVAPQQLEFARLELTHTVTSKRKLRALVEQGIVDGWDDPRMPTLRAFRRRGYPAEALREFCRAIGTKKTNSTKQIEELESYVRRLLNRDALRRLAVVDPVKLVIDNWPTQADGSPVVEYVELVNNPEDEHAGTRKVPFAGELWIERDDFAAVPPPKYFRLQPGKEVRLRGAYYVAYASHEVDDQGTVTTVHVTYDPQTQGGQAPDGRKVKATIHWVSAAHAIDATALNFERLFPVENPGERTGDPLDDVSAASVQTFTQVKAEPSIGDMASGSVIQLERLGYYAIERASDRALKLVRTIGLKDDWARSQKKN
ncbi:MAG: glutamine--tRNA ligase/YqeY domain fusion protein [Propionibacteriaceae bacterium]